MEFGASAIDNAGEAMRPQSLASQAEVMDDFKNSHGYSFPFPGCLSSNTLIDDCSFRLPILI